jgi:hypothetical protein
MKNIFTFFLAFLLNFFGIAQSLTPALVWQKCYGGSDYESPKAARLTPDQGIIMVGSTFSSDFDVTTNYGYSDFWAVKTDNKGLLQWQKSYGGSGNDRANNCQATSDGGYIFVGYTASTDGHITNNHGKSDYWVIKTDSVGNIVWQKTFGGSEDDWANSVIQTSDGGFIIAGSTESENGDVTGKHYGEDAWIVKIDGSGTLQWQKCYGGNNYDRALDIKQTNDGGFILACESKSSNGDLTLALGDEDVWIVKTNAQGTIEWQKSYGGSQMDYVRSICQTLDGGYIFASHTYSTSYNVVGNHGSYDIWIVKLTPSGDITWSKCFGGKWEEYVSEIHQTSDGGYIIAGQSNSITGNVTGNHGEEDFWVVKIQETGSLQWQMSLGGTQSDYGYSIVETCTNGYAVLGYTSSDDGNVSGNKGAGDYWLASICIHEPISLSVSDLPYCFSTTLSAEGNFVQYSWSTWATTQSIVATHGGNYNCQATSVSGCKSYAEIELPEPIGSFNNEKICLATVDEQTGKNMITVDKTLNLGTDSILFFRNDNTGNEYEFAGSISFDSVGVFIDQQSFPGERSYKYKIAVRNNDCEKESNLSPAHQIILLEAENGTNNEVNLSWTPYDGYSYENFLIYRSNAGGEFALIDNVPNTTYSYSDLAPPAGTNAYQVRVRPETPCSPTKALYIYSSSNIVNIGAYGINENEQVRIILYPNPVDDILTVKVNTELINSPFEIKDITGRVLITGKLTSENSRIGVSGLQAGIYVLEIGEKNNLAFKIVKN